MFGEEALQGEGTVCAKAWNYAQLPQVPGMVRSVSVKNKEC